MLSIFTGTPICIGLSKRGIGIFAKNNYFWQNPKGEYDAITLRIEESYFEIIDQYEHSLRQLLTQKKISRKKVSITISDEDVRYFIVAPAKNSITLQDCKDAANARFRTLYNEFSTDWEIEGAWNNHSPFLACAIPKKLTAMLHQVVKEFKSVIIELTPQFIAVFNKNNAHLGTNEWLISYSDDAMVIGIISDNRLQGIRTVNIRSNDLRKSYFGDFCDQLAIQYELPLPQEVLLYGSRDGRFKEFSKIKLASIPSQEKFTNQKHPALLWEQTVSGLKL